MRSQKEVEEFERQQVAVLGQKAIERVLKETKENGGSFSLGTAMDSVALASAGLALCWVLGDLSDADFLAVLIGKRNESS